MLLDFENLDDAATKYLQFPFLLGGLGAVLSAVLLLSEPRLALFAKLSTTFSTLRLHTKSAKLHQDASCVGCGLFVRICCGPTS